MISDIQYSTAYNSLYEQRKRRAIILWNKPLRILGILIAIGYAMNMCQGYLTSSTVFLVGSSDINEVNKQGKAKLC